MFLFPLRGGKVQGLISSGTLLVKDFILMGSLIEFYAKEKGWTYGPFPFLQSFNTYIHNACWLVLNVLHKYRRVNNTHRYFCVYVRKCIHSFGSVDRRLAKKIQFCRQNKRKKEKRRERLRVAIGMRE